MIFHTFFPTLIYAVGVVYIFVLWMLWKIVKSLSGINAAIHGIEASLKEISGDLKNKG